MAKSATTKYGNGACPVPEDGRIGHGRTSRPRAGRDSQEDRHPVEREPAYVTVFILQYLDQNTFAENT
jgi:hypothetical protein